jgi:hypothetical protein
MTLRKRRKKTSGLQATGEGQWNESVSVKKERKKEVWNRSQTLTKRLNMLQLSWEYTLVNTESRSEREKKGSRQCGQEVSASCPQVVPGVSSCIITRCLWDKIIKTMIPHTRPRCYFITERHHEMNTVVNCWISELTSEYILRVYFTKKKKRAV